MKEIIVSDGVDRWYNNVIELSSLWDGEFFYRLGPIDPEVFMSIIGEFEDVTLWWQFALEDFGFERKFEVQVIFGMDFGVPRNQFLQEDVELLS